ncbi:MAG: segregation/condensation protein A [Acidimicrobiia bacterium]|nr:MAG: segregation/condensation protein A [Acidimicrobiia bacterium]
MSFEVRTRVFEGPLDLLLQLITSHQLVITDLSLADVVNEYVAFLDDMRDLDLEVTSEFLLIAATLIQIKARHLLPEDEPIDLDEELALAEERDRLLSRLLACLTFKDVAAVLRHRMEAAHKYVPRVVGLPDEITPPRPDVIVDVDAHGLAHIAEMVFETPDLDPDIDHLDLDMPSVQDVMLELQARMSTVITSDFDEIVSHCTRDVEVVAYFLALLELARWGIVHVSQDEPNASITMSYDDEAADKRFRAMLSAEGEA